jgi:hypothetical protein
MARILMSINGRGLAERIKRAVPYLSDDELTVLHEDIGSLIQTEYHGTEITIGPVPSLERVLSAAEARAR